MDTMATVRLEDRAFGGDKPYIDLTPLNEWGKPIIKHVGKKTWAAIEAFVAQRAHGACELCGAGPDKVGVMGRRANKFAIELRFSHDETTKIATLRRLVHVCVPCNQSIHLRQTELLSSRMPPERSPMIGAIARLAQFHGMSELQVRHWLSVELALWGRRRADGYPENMDIDIVEDETNRLWR